jgi:hypothetical protein
MEPRARRAEWKTFVFTGSRMCVARLVQQLDQRWRTGKKVGKRVSVEFVEKRPLRALQRPFEPADAIDRAGIAGGVEAFDQIPTRLGTPNQPAHIDVSRRFVQA